MRHIFLKENKLSLLKEDSDDLNKYSIESIYYHFYDDEDGKEVYDVTAYDMDGNIVVDETELSSFMLDEYFFDDTTYQIMDHEGVYNHNTGLYCLKVEPKYENMDIDELTRQIFKNHLTEYHPGLHGYILTDGVCIDLGYDDHNSICSIPTIDDKFEFIALGNIRCSSNFITLIQRPTHQQKLCLRKLIANAEDLSVDIYGVNNDLPLTSVLYHGKVDPSIVLGQIDRYFIEGIKLNPNVSDHIYENYNFEYAKDDVDMSSFVKQKHLNTEIWDEDNNLNSRVRLKLLDIADDFMETLGIKWVKPIDIILTGSICNYNWSSYSDIDLHVIIDFSKISEKKHFVQEYFNSKKNEWNDSHKDLKIFGFNVELYVEDIENDSIRDGIYSLEKNSWVKMPLYGNIKPLSLKKEEKIKHLSSILLTKIEEIEGELNKPYDSYLLSKLEYKVNKLLEVLKRIRKKGLSNKGEMSVGNIIYKICRRTGYLDKLWQLKNEIYDKKNSL